MHCEKPPPLVICRDFHRRTLVGTANVVGLPLEDLLPFLAVAGSEEVSTPIRGDSISKDIAFAVTHEGEDDLAALGSFCMHGMHAPGCPHDVQISSFSVPFIFLSPFFAHTGHKSAVHLDFDRRRNHFRQRVVSHRADVAQCGRS